MTIVVGAGGFAKQLIDVLAEHNVLDQASFYDDVNERDDKFLNRYPVISDRKKIVSEISAGADFMLAIGDPRARQKLFSQFSKMGGRLIGLISSKAILSRFDVTIGSGVNILAGTVIEANVSIGTGTHINVNCSVTHDNQIGEFCELGPGVQLCGRVTMGNLCQIGAGAIVLPGARIGNGAVVGAGSVVKKNVGDNQTVVGVPAKPI